MSASGPSGPLVYCLYSIMICSKIITKYMIPNLHLARLPNARMLNIWLNIKKQLLYEENQKLGNVMQ